MTEFATIKAAADRAYNTYQSQVAQERSRVELKIKIPDAVLGRPEGGSSDAMMLMSPPDSSVMLGGGDDPAGGVGGYAAGTPEGGGAGGSGYAAPSPGPDLSGGVPIGSQRYESTPPPHGGGGSSRSQEDPRRTLSLRVAFVHGFSLSEASAADAAAPEDPAFTSAGTVDGSRPFTTGAMSFVGGEFAVTEQGGGAPRRARALFPCVDVQVAHVLR